MHTSSTLDLIKIYAYHAFIWCDATFTRNTEGQKAYTSILYIKIYTLYYII